MNLLPYFLSSKSSFNILNISLSFSLFFIIFKKSYLLILNTVVNWFDTALILLFFPVINYSYPNIQPNYFSEIYLP